MNGSRRLVISQGEFDLISESLAATVERFDMLLQLPGLGADVRRNLDQARRGYMELLHGVMSGNREEGFSPRLIG